MRDQSQGDGSRLPSDGKWYPPESNPTVIVGAGRRGRRGLAFGAVAMLSVLLMQVVPAGTSGAATASAPVLEDAAPTEGVFHAVTPTRLLDTRTGVGRPAPGRIGAGRTFDLVVSGRARIPASGVTAIVLNVTAVARPRPPSSRSGRPDRPGRWRRTSTRGPVRPGPTSCRWGWAPTVACRCSTRRERCTSSLTSRAGSDHRWREILVGSNDP